MLDLVIGNARICDGDFPSRGRRLISRAEGVEATFVAGTGGPPIPRSD